ncbi:abortive phage resistance protein [Arthrobacter sp. MYb224]|uniref:Abi family protein n=1 Tax=unclassified Arthrobacter TaxID=235627 RepID=UPI000CFA9269|nr:MULTISPECIES: Abi family protein [unclassified Arthrobacter]PRA01423.1 abortive phage resistance protein [Arthrobacter sp. MYb224]PRA06385.1 abortive phage resistance protein [Arthrobacter sp. MYb229]PRB53287.1 abortive phage resistance protein [Arthrobacter sp. MYb216]
MSTPDSTCAKPFLTIPEQIRRLRTRGLDCGPDQFASGVLERYGYYRLSGYWHLHRARPEPPADRFDKDGREIRLESFVPETSLAHVVALYEFDHELRTRLGDIISMVETSFRFHVGHRLGRGDRFAQRRPEKLGALRPADSSASPEPTTAYREWLEEYDRHEKRARGDFVVHFRETYGPHLPIWVATEAMSFGVLSGLYDLMPQGDQEILAARFQISTADGKGDRGALSNWLNNLRNVRNICAHYGRLWNRTFDVVIDAPGRARTDASHLLAPLVGDGMSNKLYGVLLILRHLMLSIAPERSDVVDVADLIEARSQEIGFSVAQLGFPDGWRSSSAWGRGFSLDPSPMLAASLLDRAKCWTAAETRAALTHAEVTEAEHDRTPEQASRALKAAQRSLLRAYRKHQVVIEVELGKTKLYPVFQFRDGKIIDALAEINKAFAAACEDAEPAPVAAALLGWWQTPHPGLPKDSDGSDRSPVDLLYSISEQDFEAAVEDADATSSFVVPRRS